MANRSPEMPPRGLFVIICGILMFAGAAANHWYLARKVEAYNEAKQVYEHRRRQLLRDIDASRERVNEKEDHEQSAD
jgi:hypothetical protein